MAEFLSPAWIEQLDGLARAAPELADAAAQRVVIEQQVVEGDGPAVVYHLVLGPGPARVVAGPAPAADLTMVTTAAAARAIAAGEVNAQECLARGSLRLRGNPEVLARHGAVLARAGDVFADARR